MNPWKAEKKGLDLFDSLTGLAQTVRAEAFVEPQALTARLAELQAAFSRDYERVMAIADVLTGPDISNYGARAAALFQQWGKKGGGPSLPALIAYAIDFFELDSTGAMAQALLMMAVLGEMPNDLQYHGNEHYRKVLFHVIRLIATQNSLFAGMKTSRLMKERDIATLLLASCIHDLGHTGGDNLKGGVYTPGALEQQAVDIARPYLEALHVDRDVIADVETLIFCTDITFFAGDNSPCLRMKKIYKHYFWDDDNIDVSMMFMGKLRRFEDNKPLVQAAMLLHEADVGSSAGLTYDQTIVETIAIMEERGAKTAGPAIVLAFLREQLGEAMFTEAGKQIFGAVMSEIISQAEYEVRMGRDTFYDRAPV